MGIARPNNFHKSFVNGPNTSFTREFRLHKILLLPNPVEELDEAHIVVAVEI
jgi:hypothetical protein